MSNVKILDKHLEHLFHSKDTFTVAKNFEGEIYRKYENRITKKFVNEGRSYFIKFHGEKNQKNHPFLRLLMLILKIMILQNGFL